MGQGEAAKQLEFVEERVSFHIRHYERKRGESRLLSALTKILSITLAGLVTTILGLKEYTGLSSHQEILSGVAFCMSAVVTALSAWESFADYNWGWVRYRNTLAKLLNLRDHIGFVKAGGEFDVDQIAKWYAQLVAILDETNSEWLQKRGASIAGKAEEKVAH